MSLRHRESAAESAERYLSLRRNRRPRRLMAKPAALAARRVTRKLQGRVSDLAHATITDALGDPLGAMLGFTAPATGRIDMNFGRATLEEIHSRLCACLIDGTDTHITRIAEDMVRSALEYHARQHRERVRREARGVGASKDGGR